MAERKIFNYTSEVLVNETFEKYGYMPDAFGRTSGKRILCSCRFCGQPAEIRKGFFNKAGSACHKECRIQEQKAFGSPFSRPEVREKAKKTNLERYGTEQASSNKEIAKKISETKLTEESYNKTKQTNLEKYGVENVFQSEEIKEKIKQTNMERYGASSPQQSEEVRLRTIETLKEKYGVDNLMRSEDIKKRAVESSLEKYGFENPMQNEDVKEKAAKTTLEKYGTTCSLQNADVADKTTKTNLERFGYAFPQSNEEIKAKMTASFKKSVIENESGYFDLSNALRGEDFWNIMKEEKYSIKEMCDIFNLNYQSLTTRLGDEEFKVKYQECYTYPKNQIQKEIRECLEKYGLTCVMNDRKVISPFELDIFIEDKKFALEYNGSYWHSEAMVDPPLSKKKHHNKLKLCREKGIRLFTLFEHTWLERKNQVLNFVKSILGKNEIKVGARECKINNEDPKQFIEDNHIQSYGSRTIKSFNLTNKGQIIASMTASKHHRQNIEGSPIVLNRMCFRNNYSVSGGSSRLFKSFVEWAKSEKYDRIISWSDNCWTEGEIYKILGFEMTKEYDPDYFYFDAKNKRYVSKQSCCKKKIKCPTNITERDWCFQNKLYRIYDCGKKMWTFNLK